MNQGKQNNKLHEKKSTKGKLPLSPIVKGFHLAPVTLEK
jgi:hypothetical protein